MPGYHAKASRPNRIEKKLAVFGFTGLKTADLW